MAGSWNHMTTTGGKLRNTETFPRMVENLGDAWETAEECYGMVWYLARIVARRNLALDADPAEPTRVQVLDVIATARLNYRAGVADGGIQRSK